MGSMERALYQKYRPRTFGDVAGQPQVVRVLETAVTKGTAAHAYLFTGPRGIGKTSAARIFAKSLGCADIDIFEIDAASHTGVDNIREITESVYTQPVESEYKVYILDEVHMLSKQAFNAFLKTLEEPPAYAVFILVTTESDKVPDTVVSRCVPLEFRQPTVSALRDGIIAVAKKEGYDIPTQTAALIALMADGSFRDSLTLLQKVIFVTDGKTIDHDGAEEVLAVPKHTLVNDYLTALVGGDMAAGITALTAATEANANMHLFAKLCVKKSRSAILVRAGIDGVIGEYTDGDGEFIRALSEKKGLTLDTVRTLAEASFEIPRSYIKTLPLEYLLFGASTKTGEDTA